MQVFIWTAEIIKTGHLDSEAKSKHKHLSMCHCDFSYFPGCPSYPVVFRLSSCVLSSGISSQGQREGLSFW